MQRHNNIKILKPSMKLIAAAIILICLFLCSRSICNTKKTLSKKQIISSKLNNIRMDVLYTRFISKSNLWQLCLLKLPSNKVEVLSDAKKFKLLGAEIGDAVFSPDGSKVLFTASDAKSPVGKTNFQGDINDLLDLWIFNIKTNKLSRITKDRQGYCELKWSPNGRYVSAHGLDYFIFGKYPPTDATRRSDILYVWNTRNLRKKEIVKDIIVEEWSSNSKEILATGRYKSIVYNTLIGQKTLYSRDRWIPENWLANGRGLLFTRKDNNSIYCISKPGSKPIILLENKNGFASFDRQSPNGTQFIAGSGDIWLMDILRKKIRKLLSNAYYYTYAWSPNGRSITLAFHGDTYENIPYSTKLVIIDVSNGKIKKLRSMQQTAQIQGWSRDGKTIIVTHIMDKEYNPSTKSSATDDNRYKTDKLYISSTKILAINARSGNIERTFSLPLPSKKDIARFADIRILN